MNIEFVIIVKYIFTEYAVYRCICIYKLQNNVYKQVYVCAAIETLIYSRMNPCTSYFNSYLCLFLKINLIVHNAWMSCICFGDIMVTSTTVIVPRLFYNID